MKRLARLLLCGAALLAAVAPVPAAAGTATDFVPILPLPIGSGTGAGTWRSLVGGVGVASARLYDESGGLRYLIRANLVRSGEPPPPGMPEHGGLQGTLLAVRERGGLEAVATLAGYFVLDPDGSGVFGVDIIVPGEEFQGQLKSVGTIEGVLHPPRAVSWLVAPRGTDTHGTSTLARLSLAWAITE